MLSIYTNALEVATKKNDKALQDMIAKYVNQVPDIEPKYVVSEGLSQILTKLMNGKISTFPLFRIALKVDRSPVKIPWSVDEVAKAAAAAPAQNKAPASVKEYKLVPEPTTAQILSITESDVPKESTKNQTKTSA